MFRQSTSTNAGTNEVARWDNLIVKDGTGKTVFSEDFENAGDYGFDEYGFVEDGMMRVGEYIYTPDSPELIVDSEYFSLQSRESTADPATFTVEGDFVLNNESTNLCFGTRNDGADCLMWQIKSEQRLCAAQTSHPNQQKMDKALPTLMLRKQSATPQRR